MKNKTILFVSALPVELQSIKKEVKKLGLVGIKIKFFLSGVGNYKTLYHLKNHLDTLDTKIDFLVNLGLCGKITSAPGSYFQVYRILGAANNKEFLCPIYIDFLKKQSILSSEKVVTSESEMQTEQYVDMESYAIDMIGTEEKIPYVIIKKPFDIVSEDSKKIDPKKFQDCLNDLNYEKFLKNIQKFLLKNHNIEEEQRQQFLEQTLKVYNFTFSEKEIWKKFYAKLIAFGGNYKNFLNDNGGLQKKEFLEKLNT